MGANEATALHLPFHPGRWHRAQAGSYSLYAIADEFEWEFVLNSNAERWGIPINDEVQAHGRRDLHRPAPGLTEPVEQLTINWHTHGGDNGHLVLEWGTTRVEIEVAAGTCPLGVMTGRHRLSSGVGSWPRGLEQSEK